MKQQKNLIYENKIVHICDKIIEYGIYSLVFFVPLVFCNKVQERFELIKMSVLQTIILIISSAFLIKIFENKKFKISMSIIYIPIFIFLLVCTLSTIFSISPLTSIFGIYRGNQGLFVIISYILFYIIFVTTIGKSQLKNINYLIIITALLMSIYAIVQRTQFDFLGTDPEISFHKRSGSFLGNPIHLGTYLAMIMPLTFVSIFTENIKRNKIIFSIFLVIMYLSLLYTYSRGAYLGFIFSFLVLTLFIVFTNKDIFLKSIKLLVTIAIAFTCLTIFVNFQKINVDNKKVSLIQRGFSTIRPIDLAAKARIYTWETTMRIIKDYKFLGVGLDAFQCIFPKYQKAKDEFSKQWIYQKFTTANKSHNMFLQTAATTGFIGLFVYLFLIILVFEKIFVLLKFLKDKHTFLLLSGISAGLIGYIICNQFSFDTITTGFMFWLFLGKITVIDNIQKEASLEKNEKINIYQNKKRKLKKDLTKNFYISKFRIPFYISLLSILIFGINFSIKQLVADAYYFKGLSHFKEYGVDKDSIKLLEIAVKKDPSVVNYHYDLAIFYSKAGNKDNAKTEYLKILKLQPYHTLTHFRLGKIYEEKGNLDKALFHYKKCVELESSGNPYIAEIYFGIGNIYCNQGNYDRGLKYYNKAIKLKTNYIDAYNNLGKAYYLKGMLMDAIKMWEKTMEILPNEETKRNLNIAYQQLKKNKGEEKNYEKKGK